MAVDLLASVAEPERSRVLSACRPRRFAPGELLVREGDPGDGLHIIESGHVSVRRDLESGDTVTLDVLGPGAVLGEVALLLPGRRRTASAVALDACTTRALSTEAFESLCRRHPGVATAISRILAERVDRLSAQLGEALHVAVDERVARRLMSIAESYGGLRSGVEVPLTQQDIADLTGATRPTVNQALKKFEGAGAIELFRGGFRVADVPQLQRFAAL